MALTDEQVERYARHLILKGVGVKGQKRLLASSVLIHAEVKLCQPGSLPRSEGKAKRVVDRRKP